MGNMKALSVAVRGDINVVLTELISGASDEEFKKVLADL